MAQQYFDRLTASIPFVELGNPRLLKQTYWRKPTWLVFHGWIGRRFGSDQRHSEHQSALSEFAVCRKWPKAFGHERRSAMLEKEPSLRSKRDCIVSFLYLRLLSCQHDADLHLAC
ncbi:hypothetical protein CA13_52280 [Planctomycetes bacterium CA13]|uniref:Uncharacterized protein n=1 Tax=Novipirellula herctigrandis TaxID=2527986 RepID=A0A5C5Z9I0_9BACT|nr:hypothetical protein CA13_52280 [Planctomycetes bacterium CA13]